MKRKDFEENLDDDLSYTSLSFSGGKSRRLDGEPLSLMQIEQAIEIPLQLEDHQLSRSILQTHDLDMGPTPMDSLVEEIPLGLYNPANISLPKCPRSIIVNSEVLPDLKGYFFEGIATTVKAATAAARNTESNNCLAVVPWVLSQFSSVNQSKETAGDAPEPMDAEEEVEMMETEGDDAASVSRQSVESDGQVRVAGGLQPWQQHQQQCMTPQLFQSTWMPVAW